MVPIACFVSGSPGNALGPPGFFARTRSMQPKVGSFPTRVRRTPDSRKSTRNWPTCKYAILCGIGRYGSATSSAGRVMCGLSQAPPHAGATEALKIVSQFGDCIRSDKPLE